MAERPCRCALCLALLKGAENAERNYQAAKAGRSMAIIKPLKRRRNAA